MTLEELNDKIDFIKECQFAFMRVDNLKWHYDKDMAEGYEAIAKSRYNLLVKAESEKAELMPKYKELECSIKEQFNANPNDKMLKLLNMHFMVPKEKCGADLKTLRDKISALESFFFKAKQHIVIYTDKQLNTIDEMNKKYLYESITKIIKDDSRNVIAINGTPNHIHILIEPAKRDVKGLVDIIKEKTCDFAKGSMWFPLFEGWAEEYAVQMVEWRDSNSVIGDIKDQENYHTRITFEAEYADMLSRDKKKEQES